MAFAVYFPLPEGKRGFYDKVMQKLNLVDKGATGLISHKELVLEGGPCAIDVWDSPASFERHFKNQL